MTYLCVSVSVCGLMLNDCDYGKLLTISEKANGPICGQR